MSDWINDRTSRDHAPTSVGAWHVVVPVKGGPDAKSRLRTPDGVDRLVFTWRPFRQRTLKPPLSLAGGGHPLSWAWREDDTQRAPHWAELTVRGSSGVAGS